MNTYKAFYKCFDTEVQAGTTYQAQQIAAKFFKARKSYDVTVLLVQLADGTPVIHNPGDL